MDPIVIVGSGLTGYSLAREFRKLDKASPLLIITSDHGESYSKPMLSNAFAQGKSPDQLVMASSVQQAMQLSAEVFTLTSLRAIDTANKTLDTTRGTLAYDRLVLALGAHQRRVPLAGDGATDVLTVNNLGDYRAFRQRLNDGARRVAIIGAGLIGCEFANDLRAGGHAVDLIARNAEPLDALVPAAIGADLRTALIAVGVTWHGPTTANRITRDDQGLTVHLENGEIVHADVVLSATGLAPNIDIARAAGLSVNRGIVVNTLLQTSAAHVYAAGDCAEVGGTSLPYVMPLMNQVRSLAKTLAGVPTHVSYPVMPVVVKTPAFPIVAVPPPTHTPGAWRMEPVAAGRKALFYSENGALLGFALGGPTVSEKAALAKLTPAPTLPAI